MQFNKEKIAQLDKIFRLNLINSISGVKPANLIGTKSEKGNTNLAIFSSVVHIGSKPPLLACITRPDAEVRRHTLENIKDSGYYTINHVPNDLVEQAHYTSAKFPEEVSEFTACNFTEHYEDDFLAPYVKESNIRIGMKFRELVPIKANHTIMIIGEVCDIHIDDQLVDKEGMIDLAQAKTAGISGLNSYYKLTKIDTFPYARVSETPNFS
jgi:flavin reductase (DIM6/NTAB) family NADH-FMN oxidoreductase RutF